MSDHSDDNDVGYGKPPKASQFKKGQAGNPNGRRKGARGLKSDLREELNKVMTVQEDGKPVKVSKQQLIIKQLANKAAQGETGAIGKILDLINGVLGAEDGATQSDSDLNQDDLAILKEWLDRQIPTSHDA